MNKIIRWIITAGIIGGMILIVTLYALNQYQKERALTIQSMVDQALLNVKASLPPDFYQTNTYQPNSQGIKGVYTLIYQKQNMNLMVMKIEYKIKDDWLSAFKQRYDFEAKTNIQIHKSLGVLYYEGNLINSKGNFDTIGNIELSNTIKKLAYSPDLNTQTFTYGLTDLVNKTKYNTLTQTIEFNNQVKHFLLSREGKRFAQFDKLSLTHDFITSSPLNGDTIFHIAKAQKLNTYQGLENLTLIFNTDKSKFSSKQDATLNINIDKLSLYEKNPATGKLSANITLSNLDTKGITALQEQLFNLLFTQNKVLDFSGYPKFFVKQGYLLQLSHLDYVSDEGSFSARAQITIPEQNGIGLRLGTSALIDMDAMSNKSISAQNVNKNYYQDLPIYGTVDFLSSLVTPPSALPYNKKQASFVIRYGSATSTANGVDSTQSNLTKWINNYLMNLDTQWNLVQKSVPATLKSLSIAQEQQHSVPIIVPNPINNNQTSISTTNETTEQGTQSLEATQ